MPASKNDVAAQHQRSHTSPRTASTPIGFDSAWTDNPRAPGAIAAVTLHDDTPTAFHPPRLVSWLRGGVQPADTGRAGMFSPEAPIWRLLADLGRRGRGSARTATTGLFLAEVFSAIAVASLDPTFFGRRPAPRFNPARRRTYRPADWPRVAKAAAQAATHGCTELADWCRAAAIPRPTKANQDRLDAALCTLIALHWRRQPLDHSVLLGNLRIGYMTREPRCPRPPHRSRHLLRRPHRRF